jgi:hypothetical protein
MRLPNELVTQGPCIELDANWRGLLLDVEPVAQYSRRISVVGPFSDVARCPT